jgi:hypothetical protein
MFDQKEVAEKVMLDEAVETNFEELQQEKLNQEMESDFDDESEKSEDFNNDQMIDEILELVNPEDDQEDKKQESSSIVIIYSSNYDRLKLKVKSLSIMCLKINLNQLF